MMDYAHETTNVCTSNLGVRHIPLRCLHFLSSLWEKNLHYQWPFLSRNSFTICHLIFKICDALETNLSFSSWFAFPKFDFVGFFQSGNIKNRIHRRTKFSKFVVLLATNICPSIAYFSLCLSSTPLNTSTILKKSPSSLQKYSFPMLSEFTS